MTAPIVAFFNNKGGVGKTSLVYHLSWMYADLGLRVLAADLDPQANLSGACLDDDALEALWSEQDVGSIHGFLQPLLKGSGDVREPRLQEITSTLFSTIGLLPGDLALSRFEDELSKQWPECLDRSERAFRVSSAFWRILRMAARGMEADIVLMDLGPDLGAINRAALLAADWIVVPLAPDLFSLQGLRNLGPTMRRWRDEWRDRLQRNPEPTLALPEGLLKPAGYVVLQQPVRLDRPVQAYERWTARIPQEYGESVLDSPSGGMSLAPSVDANCLMSIRHYRSLISMAQEARKPVFHLQAADGAIGSHAGAVTQARRDFESLARRIASVVLPGALDACGDVHPERIKA